MKFVELEVKTASVVHGFDENNREVIEKVSDEAFEKNSFQLIEFNLLVKNTY